MNPLPTFSVIVPTHNRPAALAECLAALAAMDYPKDRFEVIVVDDGGVRSLNEVAAAFLEKLNLTLIRQPNSGPGAARNNGAAIAKHEIIAFTDDDCRPRCDWLTQLARASTAAPGSLVGGRCINAFPGNLFCVTSQMILDVVHLHFNRDHENAMFFPSDNMCLPREMFYQVGGFDSAFRCAEDRDFCDRWAARGWKLVYRPQAAVEHARVMGLKGFCRQHFGYGKGARKFHLARERRGTGTFTVDGNFYMKCFLQPWRVEPIYRAIPLTMLLGLWQVVNTAGFFAEKFRPSPAAARGNAAETPEGSPSRPEA